MSRHATNLRRRSIFQRPLTEPFLSGFQLAGSLKFSKKATGRRIAWARPDALRWFSMSNLLLKCETASGACPYGTHPSYQE
jgi:hypothetical protein